MDDTQRNWLLALSSPMVALNHKAGALYSGENLWTANNSEEAKKFFEGSWNINSRDDLINTIVRMADYGHAESLGVDFFYWPQSLPSEKQTKYKTPPVNTIDVQLAYIEGSYYLTDGGGIKAWDIVRLCFLIRNGIDANYLNSDEAFFLMSRLGKRAHYWYKSWNAYYAGYLIGRLLWLSQEQTSVAKQNEFLNGDNGSWISDHLYQILYHSNNPANSLEWFTPCPNIKPPSTLSDVKL